MAGYHIREITKGTYGDFSKVVEEMEELLDAHDQNAKIMVLCELADLYGAMGLWRPMYAITTISL